MNQKALPTLAAVMIVLVAAIVAISPTGISADKGGCPHEGSNGIGNSEADCTTPTSVVTPTPEPTPPPTPEPTPPPTPEPTPTPTPEPTPTPSPTPSPTPTPVPSVDTKVVSVTVNSPVSGITGVSFLVSGTANLHNNGPVSGVLVDTTFTLVLPSGCTSPNNPTATVFNRSLPLSMSVQVTRSWNVVCSTVSEHTFTVNASSVISPGQFLVESNTANNSGSGFDMTTVVSPTPTPAP